MMPYRFLIDRAQKGLPITVFGDPSRVKEMVYIKDFTKVVIAAAGSPLEGGFYNVGSPSRVSLDEMIHGIVEVFSDPAKPSEITYDAEKPDTLQSILDWEKTRKELHYEPEYDFLTMMKDFKIEMEEEPMAGLWGKASDYSLTRSSN